jgi:uncharacterized protein YbjT (DUF2867 family)
VARHDPRARGRARRSDHRKQARLIEESGLDWTIVRGPLVFTDGPRTRLSHAGPIGRDSGPRASRADLADFMLATATDDGSCA